MDYLSLRAAFTETLSNLVQTITGFVPNLLTAAVLLLLGWIVARVARSWIRKLAGVALGRLAKSKSVDNAMERTRLRGSLPTVASAITYWIIFLFFAAAAVEKLELEVASNLVSRLAYYLPNILLGLLLILAGFIAGNLAHNALARAATSAGIAHGALLGRITEFLIILMGFAIGIDQIGIESTLLTILITIFVGAVVGSTALAFGLGSKLAVSNIISSRYLAKMYDVGQTVRVAGVEGRIIEISQTGVVLDAPEGRVLVPASKFSEEASVLVARED